MVPCIPPCPLDGVGQLHMEGADKKRKDGFKMTMQQFVHYMQFQVRARMVYRFVVVGPSPSEFFARDVRLCVYACM